MRTFFVLTLGIILAGCAAKQLVPGAERIIVTKQKAPKGCRFVGSVIGEQGGALTGGWTSNKNLAQGALNDMRNSAHRLGANYVVLETDRAGSTQSGGRYGFSGAQTDVTQTGNAYRCPPHKIGLGD